MKLVKLFLTNYLTYLFQYMVIGIEGFILISLSFKTSKKPKEILDEAEQYFIAEGLKVKEKDECCLRLEGAGGYVSVSVSEKETTEVNLEGREWDYQIKKFVERF